jgi:hypothetical protein
MSTDIPTLTDAKRAVKREARNLISWLPDPHVCDHCGSYCTAEEQFVEEQAIYMKVWQCPNEDCGARYHRERI